MMEASWLKFFALCADARKENPSCFVRHLLVPSFPRSSPSRLALLTKEAYSSLFIGVVVGALLACRLQPPSATLDTIINDGLTAAIADNAGIFLFLVILGVMVALVNATRAAPPRSAAGPQSHIHSKRRRAARDLRPRRAHLH